jgi:hypothetical protein
MPQARQQQAVQEPWQFCSKLAQFCVAVAFHNRNFIGLQHHHM